MFPISDKGLIPSKVADFHAINANKVIKEAVEEASVDIDSVGYTKGPGIGSCLNVGQLAAKTISSKYNLDIFPKFCPWSKSRSSIIMYSAKRLT